MRRKRNGSESKLGASCMTKMLTAAIAQTPAAIALGIRHVAIISVKEGPIFNLSSLIRPSFL
jgi:hypothetical protein